MGRKYPMSVTCEGISLIKGLTNDGGTPALPDKNELLQVAHPSISRELIPFPVRFRVRRLLLGK